MLSSFLFHYILNYFLIILISTIYSQKVRIFNYKIYFVTLCLSIMTFLNSFVSMEIKQYIGFLILFITNYIYSKNNLKKVFISTFIVQILIMFSELTSVLIFIGFNSIPGVNLFLNQYDVILISILTLVIMMMLIIIKFPRNTYLYLIEKIDFLSFKNLSIGAILIFCFISILFYSLFFDVNLTIYILLISIILYMSLHFISYTIEKSISLVNDKIANKENAKIIKEQNDIIEMYKMKMHEMDNQFKLVNQMVKTAEIGDTSGYINTILYSNDKEKESHELRLNGIMSQPIICLLIDKIETIKEKNIKFDFEIEKNLINKKITISDLTAFDITRILSVFLDNAIHESENIKDNYIFLNIHTNKKRLIIEIANKYHNYNIIKNIDKPHFTTKGGNHGYGLSLVKSLIKHNGKLENERIITNSVFKQKLFIKY